MFNRCLLLNATSITENWAYEVSETVTNLPFIECVLARRIADTNTREPKVLQGQRQEHLINPTFGYQGVTRGHTQGRTELDHTECGFLCPQSHHSKRLTLGNVRNITVAPFPKRQG